MIFATSPPGGGRASLDPQRPDIASLLRDRSTHAHEVQAARHMSVMWTSVDTLIVRPVPCCMTASSPLLVWRLHVDFGRVFSAVCRRA